MVETRWQGDRDSHDPGLTKHYEENVAALIKALRLRCEQPRAFAPLPWPETAIFGC
jgi:hypothetical protein